MCQQTVPHRHLHLGLLPTRTESHEIPLAQCYQGIDDAVEDVLHCKLPRRTLLMGEGTCAVA